jgi:hypothetical protein
MASLGENKHESKQVHHVKKDHDDDDDDLIFGALDEDSNSKDKSPLTDEGIHFPKDVERTKKRERTSSSISTADDEWENILPITESDGLIHQLQSINEKNSSEQIIGMSNFRAKHRLRRRSKTLIRWKDAVKKAAHLKDPW